MIEFQIGQERYNSTEAVGGEKIAIVGAVRDTAETMWNGRRFRAAGNNGATCKLCRVLVAAGCPDGPWTAMRDGKPAFYGPSVHQWAKWSIVDSEAGLKRIRYQPHPRARQ
jgi:hypothetical protein